MHIGRGSHNTTRLPKIESDYGTVEERVRALKKYYENTPRTEIPLKDAVSEIMFSGHRAMGG